MTRSNVFRSNVYRQMTWMNYRHSSHRLVGYRITSGTDSKTRSRTWFPTRRWCWRCPSLEDVAQEPPHPHPYRQCRTNKLPLFLRARFEVKALFFYNLLFLITSRFRGHCAYSTKLTGSRATIYYYRSEPGEILPNAVLCLESTSVTSTSIISVSVRDCVWVFQSGRPFKQHQSRSDISCGFKGDASQRIWLLVR